MTKTEACRRGGFKQPKQAATRIFSREDVKLYIQQKQKKLAAADDTTKEDIAAICWSILELNPIDVMVRDEKGILRIDLGAVHKSAQSLFKSGAVEVVENINGRKVTTSIRITGLSSLKSKALDTLCRMYGFYEDHIKIDGEMSIASLLQQGANRINDETNS